LLHLTDGQMLHAFGIAGMHSSGTMEYDQTGGEVKRVIAGIAARAGIQSALLAQLGLTGPPTIIEGKRGFLKVFADVVEPDEITRDLGREFKIMRIWFKLYPCVATVQGVIYTLTKLIDQHRFSADDVEEIRVGISETSLSHGGAIYEPHDTASAQFSLPFSLAIRLLKNDNDLTFYMDPKLWTDPKVLALARRVRSYADPNAKKDQNYNTTMEVAYYLRDGQRLHPDIVVLNFFVNDPETTPVPGGNLLTRHSLAAVYVNNRMDSISRWSHGAPGWEQYYEGLFDDRQPGWQKAKAAIRTLKQTCDRQGVRLVLVNYPDLHQAEPYPLGSINKTMEAVARDLAIPYLDLTPAIAGEKDPSRLWADPSDPHPNGLMHARYAAMIHDWLIGSVLQAPAHASHPDVN